MQYNFQTKDKIFSKYPQLVLIDEFEHLQDHEMKWVILFADYDSPYKDLRGREKARAIAEKLEFPKNKDGEYQKQYLDIVKSNSTHIGAACKRYKSLHYDHDKEELISMEKLRDQISTFVRKDEKTKDELKSAIEMIDDLGDLNSKIKEKRKDLQGMTLESESGVSSAVKSTIDEFMEKN